MIKYYALSGKRSSDMSLSGMRLSSIGSSSMWLSETDMSPDTCLSSFFDHREVFT